MKLFGIFLFIMLLSFSGYCQKVTISGNDTTYAGEEIVFYKFSDQISYTEEEVARTKVSENGDYSLSFEINEITKIFCYLYVFNVYLYVEPGAKYEIRIPPKTEKNEEDQLNPYFEEFITPAIVAKYTPSGNKDPKDELNFLLRLFNDSYLPYYRKHAYKIVSGETSIQALEKDIQQMSDSFLDISDPFFTAYKSYKFSFLRFLANRHDLKTVIKENFAGKEILFNNPAYMELFNEVFNDHITKIAGTSKGAEIKELISNNDYEGLLKFMKTQKHLKGASELIEPILLKGVYDAYYSGRYNQKSLIQLLDDLAENTQNDSYSAIATNLKNKFTGLNTEQNAPGFSLFDKDSNMVNLSDFEGKLVYLNFCNTKSYTCLNDFEILKGLKERHEGDFEIVSIVAEKEFTPMLQLAQNKGYNWHILHFGNDPKVLSKYDIRAYPMYYIIGPEGKLLSSPAPGPGENLEFSLFKILQDLKEQ